MVSSVSCECTVMRMSAAKNIAVNIMNLERKKASKPSQPPAPVAPLCQRSRDRSLATWQRGQPEKEPGTAEQPA